MNNIKAKIGEIEGYKSVTISGLNEGEKAILPYFLHEKSLIVLPSIDVLDVYAEQLQSLNKKVITLENKLPLMISLNERKSNEYKRYYNTMCNLAKGDYDVLLVTVDALFQKLPSKRYIKDKILYIKKGNTYNLEQLIKNLVSMGYSKEEMVTQKGEFAVRGDILDVFAINNDSPTRISFFDDEVDNINYFDENTFHQGDKAESVEIFCCSFFSVEDAEKENLKNKINADLSKLSITPESMLRLSSIVSNQFEYLNENISNISSTFFLPYCEYFNSSLFDYLQEDTKIIFDEPKLLQDKLKTIEEENVNSFLDLSLKGEFLPKHIGFYFEKKEILSSFSKFNLIAYSRLISQNKLFKSEHLVNFICNHVPKYFNHYVELTEDVYNYSRNKYTLILSCEEDLTKHKIKEFFDDKNIKYEEVESFDEAIDGKVNLVKKGVLYSAYFEMEKLVIIGSKELSAHQVISYAKQKDNKVKFLPQVGQYVVHEVHGIGKCVAIKNIKITSIYRDYIVVEYKDGDLLYVPCENADMLSLFTGEQEPKCNKIGGTEFYKVKQKVKNSIKEMAFDLLKVYGERLNSKGFVYSKDTYLQDSFESAFAYPYTEDQIQAIRDIKDDMESSRIMDRLLCGDVGYGKTEVALVAAFKAIQEGKQVAIICPTTILCEQHYSTAIGRMKDFMVNVSAINRFKTKQEQNNILKDLKDGKIDLICGTHRLLSNDVKFKDLGLIIIDEEQRFGVEDKEKLKNIKKTVDVLSLSATPIPRTLYMSLTGIRDVSFLSTPPKDRKRIVTSVIDYSDNLLVDCCKKEIDRGGQVLIVYNRVESIANFYAHVRSLLPDVKIGFAHGQMNSKMLEQSIYDLYSRKTQILISTVLIENGIDLPYANTLFVIDADKLGLSQLYQLRGRIGRSDIEAYAYFSFSRDKVLTVDAYKRLDAIMEFSDFGSGYKIALRDLEIRGAGDVLGRFQHGHMQQVGYDLYVKLLNEAVRELKGDKIEQLLDIKLDISLNAYVPNNYIANNENRIVLYTKISKIKSMQEYNNLLEEAKNTYGSVPKPVEQLFLVGLIKNLGQSVLVKKITLNEFECKIHFYKDVINTPLYQYLSGISTEFVLNEDKLPIITLKNLNNIEKQQELLIKFLLNCQEFKINN